MMDEKLDAILNKVGGIFDSAYEYAADDEERAYIIKVEYELHCYLKEKNLM
jgi:hypothetical protein